MKTKLLAVATFVILGLISILPQLLASGAAATGWDPKQVKLVGSVVSSVVLGVAALAIIFFTNDEADKRWAYAIIGTIAGYWLPSPVQ